jgi:NAD dependent epimerase/dehydratase family enzyme
MGQRGEELLLASQRVLPDHLIEAGFTFQFTEARIALANIYNS